MESCVVVTGGGTGIGRAVAGQLAERSKVVIVGRRREPLEQAARQIGESVVCVRADVSRPDGARLLAESVGGLGLLVHGVVTCAGGSSPATDAGLSLEEHAARWRESYESNVLTSVLTVEALRRSVMTPEARVVLLSSVAAIRGSGGGPYGAMKAALHAWMFDLAAELGETGGTANVVAPGFVPDTEFWSGRLTAALTAERVARTLVGRHGTSTEVAAFICWLLGPDGGWMTGQVLSPNGGSVLGR